MKSKIMFQHKYNITYCAFNITWKDVLLGVLFNRQNIIYDYLIWIRLSFLFLCFVLN